MLLVEIAHQTTSPAAFRGRGFEVEADKLKGASCERQTPELSSAVLAANGPALVAVGAGRYAFSRASREHLFRLTGEVQCVTLSYVRRQTGDVMKKLLSLVALDPPLRGFRVVGELDMSSAHELSLALISMDGEGELTLDLSELEFIDSSGLHALMQFAGSLDGGGGKLVLVNPNALTGRIFEIAELTQHPAIMIEGTSRG